MNRELSLKREDVGNWIWVGSGGEEETEEKKFRGLLWVDGA